MNLARTLQRLEQIALAHTKIKERLAAPDLAPSLRPGLEARLAEYEDILAGAQRVAEIVQQKAGAESVVIQPGTGEISG